MVKKFDITKKRLTEAKPCVVQLIRDNGTIDWYEGAEAGQLMKITAGKEKAYINLDKDKTINLVGEKDVQQAKKSKEVVELTNPETNKKEKVTVKDLVGQYVNLGSSKKRNIGSERQPVMGFICHEREFNALPNNDIKHDARQVTAWFDFIVKNYKSFEVQKIEAYKSMMLIGGVVIAIILFIVFRYGGDFFQKKEAVEGGVVVVGGFIQHLKLKKMMRDAKNGKS